MMRPFVSVMLCGALFLGGCGFGQSRLNPVNWFGSTQEESVQTATAEEINPLIPERSGMFQRSRARVAVYQGTPVEAVSSLVIERVPGGAIIRASGIAASADVFDVQLTAANDEEPVDGVLTYRLEGVSPSPARVIGNARQREVIAARSLTDQQLAGVRTIRVEARTNAQSSRRR